MNPRLIERFVTTANTTHTLHRADGFSCASCVNKLEKRVSRLKVSMTRQFILRPLGSKLTTTNHKYRSMTLSLR